MAILLRPYSHATGWRPRTHCSPRVVYTGLFTLACCCRWSFGPWEATDGEATKAYVQLLEGEGDDNYSVPAHSNIGLILLCRKPKNIASHLITREAVFVRMPSEQARPKRHYGEVFDKADSSAFPSPFCKPKQNDAMQARR